MDSEADDLYEAALKTPNNSVILEIGSHRGSSAYALALASKIHPIIIYCVDTWMGSPGGLGEWGPNRGVTSFGSALRSFTLNLHSFIESGIVIPLEMSSAGAYMVEPPITPNLIFIDGSHIYEDVLFDVTYWWSRLGKGGVMAIHDCTGDEDFHPQVRRAVDYHCMKEHITGCLQQSIMWLNKP
uniref:Putative methyltransferase n=1 Tax=viral metagenome TaxID=1070528 RepID=A0A6M3JQI3_9ZZZZ